METPDPSLIEPHRSNRVMRPLLDAFDDAVGAARVDDALATAGLPRSWFEDPEAWVSDRFHLALALALHGGPLPPREAPFWQPYLEAGRRSFKPGSIGVMWPVLRAFGSPRMVYRALAGLAVRANAQIVVTVVRATSNQAVLEVQAVGSAPELGPGICLNAVGILESVPSLWGLPPAEVLHTACQHDPEDPAPRCRYELRFRERSSQRQARLLGAAVLCGALAAAGAAVAGSAPAAWLLAGGLFGGVLESWRRAHALRVQHAQDASRFADLLAGADARYRALWEEGVALRRAILTNEQLAPYLPEDLVRKLERETTRPTLGGEERQVTILFSDLAGYSTLSEHLDPRQVVSLLNDYFGAMTALVEQHGGAVLDYVGDGLMAVFGAPEDLPDHAAAAARCALAMQTGLDGLNLHWEQTGLAAAWAAGPVPRIACRVGLHLDTVVAGNIGSHHRMKYGVVGDGVNVAARLEGLNKNLGTRILMSQDVAAALPPNLARQTRDLGAHTLKGRGQQVQVLSLEPMNTTAGSD